MGGPDTTPLVDDARATAARRRRKFVFALVTAYLIGMGTWAWWKSAHATVHVLNGLDVPAEVTIDDGPPVVVPPQERRSVRIDSGRRRFRSLVAGRIVNDATYEVSGGWGLVAYNVQGAAPLYTEDVTYVADRAKNAARTQSGPPPEPRLLAGRVFVAEWADDAFVDPPERATMRAGADEMKRRHADVAPGGWRAAVAAFRAAGDLVKPAEIAQAVAFAEIDDARVVEEAVEISREEGPPDWHESFLEKLAAAKAELATRQR